MRTSAHAPLLLEAYFSPSRNSFKSAGITLQEGVYTSVSDCDGGFANEMLLNAKPSSLLPFAPLISSFAKSMLKRPVKIAQNCPISEKFLPSAFISRAYSLALALNKHYGEPYSLRRAREIAQKCASTSISRRAFIPDDGGMFYHNKAGEMICAKLLPSQLRLPLRLSLLGMPNRIDSGIRMRKNLLRASQDAREVFLRSPSITQLAASSRVFGAISGLGKWGECILSAREHAGIIAGTRIVFEPGIMLAHPIASFSSMRRAECIIAHPSNKGAFTLS